MKKIIVLLFLIAIITGANCCKAGTIAEAITKNDMPEVARLINEGANIDEQDEGGVTPLIASVKYGSIQLTSILLKLGADPNIADDQGLTALKWAQMGREDSQKGFANYQREEMIQAVIKQPVHKKPFQKVIVDENNSMTLLTCDEGFETKQIMACRPNKRDNVWQIYSNSGNYVDMVFGLKALSVGDKQYFIAKTGNYSIKDDSWQTLKSGLKQVRPEFVDDVIIFNITDELGKTEVFKP